MAEKCLISECDNPISKLVIVNTSRKGKDGICQVEKHLFLCEKCAKEIEQKLKKTICNALGDPVQYHIIDTKSFRFQQWLNQS